ncbi:succinate-semialdehyde dehydrogenase / glutarate-semialdehyde dehydrogenase [Allopseudospirillum japonicum]|uniref:Succinate-semialdehyde dehydrogenase / glutarate-semialdehyde dehydrogenase n=1 Tax=Allopseudospirillum japonicum TaxID=64971 RepID=A0A1H6R4S6_9GAMM|nr:NAD-dependent succinate-semialdehyde dehydrogenase [Allopseudospirillum japonicum]SEI50821.1 succinate-semialdehyde dehydrogenase / glutarate-semialdehyde dehydrogenase [Allopseudospirillum japonicum]
MSDLLKDALNLVQAYLHIKHPRPSTQYSIDNPANVSTILQVPDMDAHDAEHAIAQATQTLPQWRSLTARERSKALRRWHDLVLAHQEELALLLTTEQGKPLAEARGEIAYGASYIEWFAEEAVRAYGDVTPSNTGHTRLLTIKQPIGVVSIITPWNFPNAMLARKLAPALAVGCTCVVKPAEDTPLSALALAALAEQAGIPAGAINIVTTSRPAPIGEVLCTHAQVRKVSFTGSTPIGKHIAHLAASSVKRVSLELGGNAPFIVFDDADIPAAVQGALASKYRNAGQTCVCTNRFYIQEGIYDAFVAEYARQVALLKTGAGTEADTQIGPLINQAACAKVDALVKDAIRQGAKLTYQGAIPDDTQGHFYPVTLLTQVTEAMALTQEEIFGPVSALMTFKEEAEVIQRANATPYGLAAYFYARDIGRIWRVAEALDYGMIGINEGIISNAAIPFGGVKESGLGREGSRHGLDDYLETKFLCMGF